MRVVISRNNKGIYSLIQKGMQGHTYDCDTAILSLTSCVLFNVGRLMKAMPKNSNILIQIHNRSIKKEF